MLSIQARLCWACSKWARLLNSWAARVLAWRLSFSRTSSNGSNALAREQERDVPIDCHASMLRAVKLAHSEGSPYHIAIGADAVVDAKLAQLRILAAAEPLQHGHHVRAECLKWGQAPNT